MRVLYTCLTALVFGFLASRPAPALEASAYGLTLWFHTLVPTLLPFLILSGFCIQSGMLSSLSRLAKRLPGPFKKLSWGGLFALTAGMLCGFPTGAKILGDLRRNGKISAREGQCLLSFCNNASPGFVLTFLIHQNLGMDSQAPILLGIFYGLPLLYGCLSVSLLPPGPKVPETEKASSSQITFGLLDACIYDAAITLIKLGGYIILFSILAKILECLPFLSRETLCLLTGILELTGGIDRTADTLTAPLLLPAIISMVIFGGLCTLAQTASVLKGSGLSIKKYIVSRLALAVCGGLTVFLLQILGILQP